jgi:hypothetical protein
VKKTLAFLACSAALLPGAALASEYSSSDTLIFAATSSSYAVDFSWVDAFFTKNTKTVFSTAELDGKYSWVLTDLTTNQVFAKDKNVGDEVTGDKHGVLSGGFYESFSSLTAGHTYKLLFTGDWAGGKDGKNWILTSQPLVALTAAVPEPETYAMLLAGFGLIGTMVRRRSSRS